MSDVEKNTAKVLDGQKNQEETTDDVVQAPDGSVIHVNASGHVDSLTRQYGLLSVCGLALNIGEASFFQRLELSCQLRYRQRVDCIRWKYSGVYREWRGAWRNLGTPDGVFLLWVHRCFHC